MSEILLAIRAYAQDHGGAPPSLEALAEDSYIDPSWVRGCPNLEYVDRLRPSLLPTGGLTGRSQAGAYFYEYNHSSFASESGDITWAEWKALQYELAGALTPIVRCNLHGEDRLSHFLNLGLNGRTYISELLWESLLGRNYSQHLFGGDSLFDNATFRALSMASGLLSFREIASGRSFSFSDTITKPSPPVWRGPMSFDSVEPSGDGFLPATENARTLEPYEATFLVGVRVGEGQDLPEFVRVTLVSPKCVAENRRFHWKLPLVSRQETQRVGYYAIGLRRMAPVPAFPPQAESIEFPLVDLRGSVFANLVFAEKRIEFIDWEPGLEPIELAMMDRALKVEDLDTLAEHQTLVQLLGRLAEKKIDLVGLQLFRPTRGEGL